MRRDNSGIGTGIVLVTIGLMFFASNQFHIGIGHLWPVILIMLGVRSLVFPRQCDTNTSATGYRRRPLGGVWLIAIGVLFLLDENRILRFGDSWPLIIVLAGVGVILSGLRQRTPPPDSSSGPGFSNFDGFNGGQR